MSADSVEQTLFRMQQRARSEAGRTHRATVRCDCGKRLGKSEAGTVSGPHITAQLRGGRLEQRHAPAQALKPTTTPWRVYHLRCPSHSGCGKLNRTVKHHKLQRACEQACAAGHRDVVAGVHF